MKLSNRRPLTHYSTTIAIITALSHALPAQAIQFTYTPDPGASAQVQAAMQTLANDINSNFSAGMENDFLGSMANASRNSLAGVGTDGVVRGDLFSISTSAGLSMATAGDFGSFKSSGNSLPGVGLGVQPAVTLGMNAKWLPRIATLGLDPAKVDYFFHFGKIDLSDLSDEFGFNITNFGLMGRYWIFDPQSALWAFRWDGLSVSSGLQYSSMSATVNTSFNFSTGGGASDVNWAPDATLGISANTFSIPVDVRSGITLLKFWTLYGSAGARFSFGTAKTEGAIAGEITNALTPVGTGTLDLTSEGQGPSLISGRFGLGSQLNFGPLKLYAEAAYSTPKVVDATLGARFVW